MSVWPRKKSFYKVHSLPDTVKLNPRLAQISPLKSFPQTLTFHFSLSEAQALDRAVSELVQAQSFSFWLMSSFFLFLNEEEFQPSNQSLFDKYTSVISSIMQSQSHWTLAIEAFLTLIRRKSILSKLFSGVLPHQKDDLLRSPCFSEFLFDPDTLEKVINDFSKMSHDNTQFQMAKFFASGAFSRASGSNFSPRGSRRPFSRPFFVARGKGGRGGRGRGKSGGNKNHPKKSFQNKTKNA